MEDMQGGSGDCARFSRSDFAMLRRAAREQWGVPDPLRTEALYRAAKALADPEASHRDRLAASKFLLEADKVDQANEALRLAQARFAHESRPPEAADTDFAIDLAPGIGEAGG